MNLRATLYRAARLLGDAQAVQRSIERGSVAPVEHRAKNRIVGRVLGRAGFWRALWR